MQLQRFWILVRIVHRKFWYLTWMESWTNYLFFSRYALTPDELGFSLLQIYLLSWLVNMLTAHVHILEWQANGTGGSIDSSSISSRFITGNCSHGSFMLLLLIMDLCYHASWGCPMVVVLSSLLIITTSQYYDSFFVCLADNKFIASWHNFLFVCLAGSLQEILWCCHAIPKIYLDACNW